MKEQSYIDLLTKLHADIESDTMMPMRDRKRFIDLICYLKMKLWKYSH